jgi:hypothetical protein
MPLLPEEKADEGWELSDSSVLSSNREHRRNSCSILVLLTANLNETTLKEF